MKKLGTCARCYESIYDWPPHDWATVNRTFVHERCLTTFEKEQRERSHGLPGGGNSLESQLERLEFRNSRKQPHNPNLITKPL